MHRRDLTCTNPALCMREYAKHMMKIRSALSAITVAALVVLGPITAASAHAELLSTNPADGSSVLAPPMTISLTFSEPPLLAGSDIALSDSTGAPIATDAPSLTGAEISVPWPVDMPPGDITVAWRITADDGHVQDGKFAFKNCGVDSCGTGVGGAGQPTPVLALPTALTALDDGEETESGIGHTIQKWAGIALGIGVGVVLGIVIRKRK